VSVGAPPDLEQSEAKNRLGEAQRHFGERQRKDGEKRTQRERDSTLWKL